MVTKFTLKQRKALGKEFAKVVLNEDTVPSGGWCTSCQKYDCGHFTDKHGDVIIRKGNIRASLQHS